MRSVTVQRAGIGACLGVVLFVGFLAAGPAMAQADEDTGFTPEDDLDCAMFVGALLADNETENTPDNRIGLTSALTYFVGRYEARRGLDLTAAFRDRYPLFLDRNPAEIQQICSIRMRAFSNRLQAAGGELSRMQPPQSPALQEQPGASPSDQN